MTSEQERDVEESWTIEVPERTLVVSDPCYLLHEDVDPSELGLVVSVADSVGTCHVEYMETWGTRVSAMQVDFGSPVGGELDLVGTVGVDAGMVMFTAFENAVRFGEDPSVDVDYDAVGPHGFHYQGACNATLRRATLADVIGGGRAFASSSGIGDGEYEVWATKNEAGEATSVRVVFLEEEDDGDEDDDEEYACDACGEVVDELTEGMCEGCREEHDYTDREEAEEAERAEEF